MRIAPKLFVASLTRLKQHLDKPAFKQSVIAALQSNATPDQLSQETLRPSDPMQNPVPSQPVTSNQPRDISVK